MGWNVDLTEDTVETLDQVTVAPGWYKAVVESAAEEQKMANVEVQYRITSPPYNGVKIEDIVWNPENASTEDLSKSNAERAKKVMKRLGLIGTDQLGKQVKVDWPVCIGKEVVIQVVHKEKTSQKGNAYTRAQLAYLGMYPLDHGDIPVAERIRLGLPLLEGQTPPKEGDQAEANGKGKGKVKGTAKAPASSTPAKAEVDLSDLM